MARLERRNRCRSQVRCSGLRRNAVAPASRRHLGRQEHEDQQNDQADERNEGDPEPPAGAIGVMQAPNEDRQSWQEQDDVHDGGNRSKPEVVGTHGESFYGRRHDADDEHEEGPPPVFGSGGAGVPNHISLKSLFDGFDETSLGGLLELDVDNFFHGVSPHGGLGGAEGIGLETCNTEASEFRAVVALRPSAAGPFGPATPGVVVVVLFLLLVDPVPADLVAGSRKWAKHHLAANSGVFAGATDDRVGDFLARGSAGIGGDERGCVDRVLADLESQVRLAVLSAPGDGNTAGDLAGGVGADRIAAADFADGAVGDGDVAGVVAVALDIDDLAVGAVDEPDEIGLVGRGAGGGDEGAGDGHEGCGDDGGDACFGLGCVHGVEGRRVFDPLGCVPKVLHCRTWPGIKLEFERCNRMRRRWSSGLPRGRSSTSPIGAGW